MERVGRTDGWIDDWKKLLDINNSFSYLPTTLEEPEPVGVVLPSKGDVREGQSDRSRGAEGWRGITTFFPRDLRLAFPRQPEICTQNSTSQNVI